ncbi:MULTISPECIES: hypothetical protein [Gammaproteobacteria]|uniref:Uncharacterized protein n=1 Tax=Alloalcanivorax xenomutans TaxID=1094342 RepID=A0A9Q3ZEP8_9GAMM|nr:MULTISPECIES: hypothetical protein [Gammaproteobacteria]ARB47200.1 hypothetical protein P40_18815 [Alloalcanivorax xenomutans]MCE7510930.1 hypothetical protein [Alloalcanivorax xenomutans]HIO99715.1 hypothetical protein [Marinobacter salarius]
MDASDKYDAATLGREQMGYLEELCRAISHAAKSAYHNEISGEEGSPSILSALGHIEKLADMGSYLAGDFGATYDLDAEAAAKEISGQKQLHS